MPHLQTTINFLLRLEGSHYKLCRFRRYIATSPRWHRNPVCWKIPLGQTALSLDMNNRKSKPIIGIGSSQGLGLRIKPQATTSKRKRWWAHDQKRGLGAVGESSTSFLSKFIQTYPNVHLDALSSSLMLTEKGQNQVSYLNIFQIKVGHLANSFRQLR